MAKLPQILKPRICKHCKETITLTSNVFSNHVKHCKVRLGSRNYVNNAAANRASQDRRHGEVKSFKVCCANTQCNKFFEIQEREFKFPSKEKYFCSRSCANRRQPTAESNLARSVASKNSWTERISKMTESELEIFKNKSNCFTSQGERDLLNLLQTALPMYGFTSGGSVKIDNTLVQRDIISKTNKIVIEYDGPWHFIPITGEENLKKKQYKDQLLNRWCFENNVRLIRVSPFNFKKFSNIFNKLVNLITNSSDLYSEMYNDNLNKDIRYTLRNTVSDF